MIRRLRLLCIHIAAYAMCTTVVSFFLTIGSALAVFISNAFNLHVAPIWSSLALSTAMCLVVSVLSALGWFILELEFWKE